MKSPQTMAMLDLDDFGETQNNTKFGQIRVTDERLQELCSRTAMI